MIKAIIFDYGGVVKKSCFSWAEIGVAYQTSAERVEEKAQPLLKLFQKGFITEEQFWEKLSEELRSPLPQNIADLFRKEYDNKFYLYPEIVNFIRKLKDKGFKTAVLSNTIKPHVEIIKKYNGYKNFDVVILSCEVGFSKPEKKIYLLTVNKLAVNAQECVFVDDKEENIEPAKKLGMRTVLARNAEQVIDEIYRIINPETDN